MIPASDHHTRSLLLRRVSSWSQQSALQESQDEVGGYSLLTSSEDEPTSRFESQQDYVRNLVHRLLPGFEFEQPPPPAAASTSNSSNQGMEDGERSMELAASGDGTHHEDELSGLDELLASTDINREEANTARVGHHRRRPSMFLPHERTRKNVKLYIVLVLLIVSGVGNVTLSKLQALPMYNYPTFLNLYASFLYIPLSFAYIIPMSKFGSTIPATHFAMNKWPFFVMGALDSISTCMQVLCTIYLPGKLLVLLPQAAIPLSIWLSRWILREQFTRHQYVGALVVMSGILIVLFPIWTSRHAPDYSCQAVAEFQDDEDFCNVCQMETNEEDCISHNIAAAYGANEDGKVQFCQWISKDESLRHDDVLIFIWSLVMIASCIPMTFSSIYKQVALSAHANLDPLFVNGWVAIFQFLCSLPLAIPAGLASSPSVSPWELPRNWHNAWQCLFRSHNNLEGGCHPDQCEQAALWVHLGLVASTAYSVLIIFMLKYGSSALLYMALTLMVPLGHLVFALHDPSNIRLSDILGLIVLITGLVMYRFGHSDDEDGGRQEQFGNSRSSLSPNGQARNSLVDSNNRTSLLDPGQTSNDQSEGEMYFRFFREPFLLSGDV